ncbi:MAG: RNA polymerase sigma factor [Eubacterium sp.]|nr:RNA polymerase sigma factor [Eubacterium sp.]
MIDRDKFAELYKEVYRELYKTALYRLGVPEDAENVVSDTVLDAYAGLDKLRDESAFRAWIFKILSNKINRVLREYVTRREHEAYLSDDSIDALPTAGNVIQAAEDKTLVQQAFTILSEEEREIVTMSVFGEQSSAEIADSMKLNRNTVRSKYSRALTKMREYLDRGGDMYGQKR